MAFAAALSLVACEQQPGPVCTDVACFNLVTISIDVPRSPQELVGARLEVCRNEQQCVIAFLVKSTSDTLLCSSGRLDVSLACGPPVALDASSNVSLQVWYSPLSQHDLVDGDRFTLRVTDKNASVVWAEKTGSIAKYEEEYPNGRDCDREYFCRLGGF